MKNRPNRFTNAHDFLWATEYQRLEHGNAFWVMQYGGGSIRNFYLLDSRNVQIYIDNTGILSEPNSVFYMYADARQGKMFYTGDDIIHFKNFSLNGITGTGIKRYIGETIENEQYSQKILREKYDNGLQNPIVVQYVGDLNDALKKKYRLNFQSSAERRTQERLCRYPQTLKCHSLKPSL